MLKIIILLSMQSRMYQTPEHAILLQNIGKSSITMQTEMELDQTTSPFLTLTPYLWVCLLHTYCPP